MTKVTSRLLNVFNSASKGTWTYIDLENALIGNEGIDNYHDVKEVILEADNNVSLANVVEHYLRTLKAANGNLPCELERLGEKYKV